MDELKAFIQKNKTGVILGSLAVVVLALGIIFWPRDNKRAPKTQLQKLAATSIEQQLGQPKLLATYFSDMPRRELIIKALQEVYDDRNMKSLWLSNDGLTPEGDSALVLMGRSFKEGLEPNNYAYEELKALRDTLLPNNNEEDETQPDVSKADPKLLARLELGLSANWLQMGMHLATGRINPAGLDTNWKFAPRKFAAFKYLTESAESGPAAQMQSLLPNDEGYAHLKLGLARLRAVAYGKNWPEITTATLDSGMSGPAVAALKTKLALWGVLDTTQSGAKTPIFDTQTCEAVRSLRVAMGMKASSHASEDITSVLNQPLSWWTRLAELNLERWRWKGTKPTGRFIFVNVPEYRLSFYEDGHPELTMRVVVGDGYHSTPVFNDKIEYLVFNPEWVITENIAKKEVLPLIQRKPEYIQKDSIKVLASWEKDAPEVDPATIDWQKLTPETFPYKLVQKAGSRNPLGRVKFILPNNYDIYLHDTPFRWAFHRGERDMSHGCIRLHEPMKLALRLLENQGESGPEWIKGVLASQVTTQVNLDKPVPVQLLYFTLWADEHGKLSFRQDLYGHDADHMRAIYDKEKKLMAAR